jgi:sialate O-acetylesterase
MNQAASQNLSRFPFRRESLLPHKATRFRNNEAGWVWRFGVAALFGLLAAEAKAALSPAKIFTDHMVLQRHSPVPIWGTATPGNNVTVLFAGKTVETTVGDDGKWHVTLAPLEADATGRELRVSSGGDSTVINDVVVGEVWFAGGQSNMQYTASSMARLLPAGKALVATADLPAIRFCRIHESAASEPRMDLSKAQWDTCSPHAVLNHSAVGLVFARRLHLELNVPVGVIDSSVGGTPIEPYIPEAAFTGHPTLEKLLTLARAGDKQAIMAMPGGTYVRGDHWLAGRLYNGRIAPVVPYAIRGAIWYQGESNCGTGEDPRDYALKLQALVTGWRAAWGQPELPVYVVQLPQWKSYAWPFLREEQRRAVASLKNSGLTVTIDLDHANDIHPPNKIDVGERLARWPLARIYGRTIEVQGPVFRSAEVRDGGFVVSFDHADGGLMTGISAGPGEPVEDSRQPTVSGCELCDEAGEWHAAEARIQGTQLLVTSPEVTHPVAVRYASLPEAAGKSVWNLFGKSGLPAAPFCSDPKRMRYDPSKNPR